jgi:hypothetical protein
VSGFRQGIDSFVVAKTPSLGALSCLACMVR